MTITFSQTLWRKDTTGKLYPVEHDASYSTTVKNGCLGLGACFDVPPAFQIPALDAGVAPIGSVRFNIQTNTNLRKFTFTLRPGNLYNQWGTAIPAATIEVTVKENGEAECIVK